MIANHIHDALSQVKKLREIILEKSFFRGYSGRARMAGGLVVLAGGLILSTDKVPADNVSQLTGWCVVMLIALLLNYGGLAIWYFRSPAMRCDPAVLMPAIDAIPALAVGGVLTLSLILKGHYDLLFGVWMSLYGLVHIAYRQTLPKANYIVGMFYIVSGAFCLLAPGITFVEPWPMAVVFFAGETAGGAVLYRNRLEEPV